MSRRRVGRPDRLPDEVTALDFRCPHCQAPAGHPCTGAERYRERGHAPRQDRAGRAQMRAGLAVVNYVEHAYGEAARWLGQAAADEVGSETFALRRAGDHRAAVALADDLLARCGAAELL